MGINNWFVQRALRSQAKRIADWADKAYADTKASYPDLKDHEIHQKMLGADPDLLSPDAQHRITECGQTIEGISYLMASVSGMMEGWANFRCLQFTTLIDAQLYKRGFERQSREMKEKMLATLDFPLDDWEEWAGEA